MVSFSVIVPIYNGEKYTSRAVESVLSQSYPAKEIILIDDGSKDGSYKKCTELAEAHGEIRCIHKENSGVSADPKSRHEHCSIGLHCLPRL